MLACSILNCFNIVIFVNYRTFPRAREYLDKEVDDLEEALEEVREEAAGRDLESEAVNEVVLPNFNKYYRQSTKRWSLS